MIKGIFITGNVAGEPEFAGDSCLFKIIAKDGTMYSMTADEYSDLTGIVSSGSKLTVMGKYKEETPKEITVDTIFFN